MTGEKYFEIKLNKDFWVLLLSAILITALLFFIDEGYYNFDWILSAGAWLVFIMYVIPIFAIQLALNFWVFKKIKGLKRMGLSLVFGTIVGLIFIITSIFA